MILPSLARGEKMRKQHSYRIFDDVRRQGEKSSRGGASE